MRILYCYPYYGELGWELANWVPHVAWVMKEHGPFDHSVAWVRLGHESLYRGIDKFCVADNYEGQTEGNAFVLHCHEAYDFYHEQCRQAELMVKKLESEGHTVVTVRLPQQYYRYHRYKDKRLVEPLIASDELLAKWSSSICQNAVIFHLRAINRSVKKNTPAHLYRAAADWARKHDRQFVTVGRTGGYQPGFPIEGTNLLNKTDLGDLIAILNLGGMVVGSSSGPMHMAAIADVPHVVWGGGRGEVRARYLKNWNPFNTPVDHLTTAFNFSDKSLLLAAMTRMASVADSHVKRRIDHVQTMARARGPVGHRAQAEA